MPDANAAPDPPELPPADNFRFQGFLVVPNTSLNVFVSLNPFKMPNKSLIHKKIVYEHPIFNNGTNEAQKLINKIQGKNNIYYAGAWLGYGFHEDGISSAIDISKNFDIKVPWIEK